MRYVLTGDQSKELDRHAIETAGFPSLVLMEKAAMTLVSVICEREKNSCQILVVCGIGNNGGDGLAAARLLSQQGYFVAVAMVGDAKRLSEDAKVQLRLAVACDVSFVPADEIVYSEYDFVIDALFGVGLARDITGVYAKVILDMNRCTKKVYAVDVPSGINSDDGRIMNVAIKADVTVTFGANKRGLILYPGCRYAGEIIIGDIGYPAQSYHAVNQLAYYYEPEDLKEILPERRADGHKGTFGHVAVIGGSQTMCGAVCFSAQAAYASGAGLVRVCTMAQNRELVLSAVPEALVDSYGDAQEPDYKVLDEVIEFADVVVLGPGIGLENIAKKVVSYVIAQCDKTLILDGDGISHCTIEDIRGRKNLILTPHPKEFSRIIGQDIPALKERLIQAVTSFSEETGCVMVGKDARTIVGCGRDVYMNVSGNSGLGTAGSGDVLTGIIAAFVAQGLSAFEAAKAGVYVHGLAADFYVREYNPYSLTATELIHTLKYVLDAH